MNKKLKAKIIERFGSQFIFARLLKIHEAEVSLIVRGRRQLPPEKKQKWCEFLGCDLTIFDEVIMK
jgi:DNA-binding transcriptional regulator YdaS (Cro superfamily)